MEQPPLLPPRPAARSTTRISSKATRSLFQPDKFEDRYKHALKDLIKKKQKGVKIEAPNERAPSNVVSLPSNVVSLMDALRQCVKEGCGGRQW